MILLLGNSNLYVLILKDNKLYYEEHIQLCSACGFDVSSHGSIKDYALLFMSSCNIFSTETQSVSRIKRIFSLYIIYIFYCSQYYDTSYASHTVLCKCLGTILSRFCKKVVIYMYFMNSALSQYEKKNILLWLLQRWEYYLKKKVAQM